VRACGVYIFQEPGNIRNIHGFKANGFIHKKTIDIRPTKDKKGIVVIRKRVRKAVGDLILFDSRFEFLSRLLFV
jgi:hypothetical protein